jgi:peptidoglycan/LPS O-acetylase OafA/YrhL
MSDCVTRPLKTNTVQPGFYRPELDAMRFFAFLCVFLHHALTLAAANSMAEHITFRNSFASSAKFAVSLFFMLSGYLISTLLAMEKERTGKVHLAEFYKRRIARIWPVYYAFTILVLLIGTVVPRVLPSAGALAATTLFAGNWFLIFGGANFIGGLGILWSVNIEEQFYLIWPLIAKYSDRRRFIAVSTAILITAYIVLIVFGALGIVSDLSLRFNPFVEMQFFAAGALLAIYLPRQGLHLPASLRVLLASIGVLFWMAGNRFFGEIVLGSHPAWWRPSALYAFVLVGCVAIFLGFFGIPGRFISPKIVWLGKISYGLYVYHVVVLSLTPRAPVAWGHQAIFGVMRLGLALSIVIFLASLSYRWLELPFLRWKERITFVPNRSA